MGRQGWFALALDFLLGPAALGASACSHLVFGNKGTGPGMAEVPCKLFLGRVIGIIIKSIFGTLNILLLRFFCRSVTVDGEGLNFRLPLLTLYLDICVSKIRVSGVYFCSRPILTMATGCPLWFPRGKKSFRHLQPSRGLVNSAIIHAVSVKQ